MFYRLTKPLIKLDCFDRLFENNIKAFLYNILI